MDWQKVVRSSAPVVNRLRRESGLLELPETAVVRPLLSIYGSAALNEQYAKPESRAGFAAIRRAARDALGLHGDTLLGIFDGAGLDPVVLDAFRRASTGR